MIGNQIRRSSPNVEAKALAGWLTAVGIGLGLWLLFAPTPLALILNIAAPAIAVILARLGWNLTLAVSEEPSGKAEITTLWAMPCVALALTGLRSQLSDPYDTVAPAALVALVPFAAIIATDPAARRWWAAPLAAAFAFCWTWGGLVGVDTIFDRSTPAVVAGTLTNRHDGRNAYLEVAVPERGRMETFRVRTSRRWASHGVIGVPACLAIRPGVLRWRHHDLAPCP
jgi:hypothetical protein